MLMNKESQDNLQDVMAEWRVKQVKIYDLFVFDQFRARRQLLSDLHQAKEQGAQVSLRLNYVTNDDIYAIKDYLDIVVHLELHSYSTSPRISGLTKDGIGYLTHAVNLQDLTISSMIADHLNPLVALAHLNTLNLINCENIDFDSVSKMIPRLRKLSFRGTDIKDLDTLLASAANLQELSISSMIANKLGALVKLTHLKTLRLLKCTNLDCDSIKNMSWLHELDLSGSDIAQVDFLPSLPHLKILKLRNTKIDNLEPISTSRNLHTLDLSGPGEVDLKDFAILSQLRKLYLAEKTITNLYILEKLLFLKKLDLKESTIVNSDSHEDKDKHILCFNLGNLQKLRLPCGGITCFEGNEPIVNLEVLEVPPKTR